MPYLIHQSPQPTVAIYLRGRHVQKSFASSSEFLQGLTVLAGTFDAVDRPNQAKLLLCTFH